MALSSSNSVVKKHVWTRGRSGGPSARFGHSAIAFGTKLLVFGGHNGHEALNDCFEYNLESNVWLAVAPAAGAARPPARFAHRGVFHENRFVVFGGSNGSVRFNDVWMLDLSRPGAYVWRELPPAPGTTPPTERASAACVVVGSRLVVVGGYDGARSNECYELDLASLRWRLVPLQGRMPYLSEHTAVLASGERILLFGGAASSTALSDELFEIDLARLTVRSVPTRGPRPPPRMGHVAALLGAGSRMVVFGGRGESGAPLNDLHTLQLDSLTWQPVPARPGRRNRMPQPRAYAGAAVFKDFLYVLGGLDGHALDSLWIVNLVVQSDLSRRAPDGIRELKLAREKGLGRACFGCGNKFKMFKKRLQCSSCTHVFCGPCFAAGAGQARAVAALDDAAAAGSGDDDSDGDDDAHAPTLHVRDARDVCRDCRRQQLDASDAAHQRYRFAPSAAQVERRKALMALRLKPLDKFTVDDVGLWLSTVGLQRYAGKFRDSAIDGAMLPELTVERLRQYCGMTDTLHSRSFFTAVARLRRNERTINEYADVASWTPEQVGDWMAELGLLPLLPLFADSCVHGALLRSLTDDDLRALGVERPLVRKKVLFCISRLLNPPPPSPLAALGVDQVVNWLSAHGLGSYDAAFRASSIDGVGLLLLTDALLASDLAVQSEWHRRSILAGTAALLEKLERPNDDGQAANALYWSMALALQWSDTNALPLEWRNAMRQHALHGAMLLVLNRRHVVDIFGAAAPAAVVDQVTAALADLQQAQAKRFGAARHLPLATSAWAGAAFLPVVDVAPPATAVPAAAVPESDEDDDDDDDHDDDRDDRSGNDGHAADAHDDGDGPAAAAESPMRTTQSAASLMARVDARRAGYQPLARMNLNDGKGAPAAVTAPAAVSPTLQPMRALPPKPTPASPTKTALQTQLQQWEKKLAGVGSSSSSAAAAPVAPTSPETKSLSSAFVSSSAYADTAQVVSKPAEAPPVAAAAPTPTPVAAPTATPVRKELPPLPVRASAEERPSLAALQRVVSATSAATTVSGAGDVRVSSAASALSALDAAGKRRQLSGEELLAAYKSAIPARYHISFSELLKQSPQKVGEGAHGVVFKCQYRSVAVAVKQLKNVSLYSPELREFVAEAVLMAELKPHPHVVSFLGLCLEPLCLVVEYLARGSLGVLLADAGIALPMARKLSIVRDIAAGMLHLSLEKVVHKDLAARNVLIGEHWEAKVSDFGMSRILSESNNEHYSAREVGPLKWMAPESLRQKIYSSKSDVWSFAVTVVEILTRSEPYPKLDIVRFATQFFIENLSLMADVPDDCPPRLRQLLARCFVHDADKRPSFQQICEFLKLDMDGAGEEHGVAESTRE